MTPSGCIAFSSSTVVSGATSIAYTPASRTRRAISCTYCEPKSRIGMTCPFSSAGITGTFDCFLSVVIVFKPIKVLTKESMIAKIYVSCMFGVL